MNPILRETLDKIKKHMNLTEGDEMFLMREIGYCMSKVAYGCSTNPNFNLCGGEYVDENSYVSDNFLYENIFEVNENINIPIDDYFICKYKQIFTFFTIRLS